MKKILTFLCAIMVVFGTSAAPRRLHKPLNKDAQRLEQRLKNAKTVQERDEMMLKYKLTHRSVVAQKHVAKAPKARRAEAAKVSVDRVSSLVMYDEEKGLYYHGYDASRCAFWADPVTGCSRNFWLRSIGWFAVALADLCEILPDGEDNRKLRAIFRELMSGVARYADEATGMYWQVVDQGGREGNYLETSGSSMIAYAMLKGARLGILDKEYTAKGEKTFRGIVEKYLSFSDGALNLGGICLVAGLGPENNRRRDGSYEYYISEPVVENDAKGVAPFLLCYTEIKRL